METHASRARIIQVVLSTVALLVLAGCATTSVAVNPHAKFPLVVDKDSPAFLFPINMSHLRAEGDPNVMGVGVSASVVNKYGAKIVSGQQLFDLVGNLSFDLAEAINSAGKAGRWQMTGPDEKVANDLAMTMEKVLSALSSLKVIPAGYKFKYIVIVHSHGNNMVPGVLSLDNWGGIYNMETKEIYSYFESHKTIANQQAAVLAQVPGMYNELIDRMINGT